MTVTHKHLIVDPGSAGAQGAQGEQVGEPKLAGFLGRAFPAILLMSGGKASCAG